MGGLQRHNQSLVKGDNLDPASTLLSSYTPVDDPASASISVAASTPYPAPRPAMCDTVEDRPQKT